MGDQFIQTVLYYLNISSQWFFARLHVFATFFLVILLPFSMNELEARENLVERLNEKIASLDSQIVEEEKRTEPSYEVVEQLRNQKNCYQNATAVVDAIQNGGMKDGLASLSKLREMLIHTCSQNELTTYFENSDDVHNEGQETAKPVHTKSSSGLFKQVWPNRWPSQVLVFFIVSVCGIMGYAATAMRDTTHKQIIAELTVSTFKFELAILAAVLSFGFLLALRSGYILVFAGLPPETQHNVFGLAFIGFLIGLFTLRAYDQLKRAFDRIIGPDDEDA